MLFGAVGCQIIIGEKPYEPKGPYIGILSVEGTIASANTDSFGLPVGYQHDFTLDAIDDMINDNNNKGLILFVDSPGGGVYESDELYYKLKKYKEATGRPVYSYMGSMAASGGYYISAPANKILANRNTWTGSIGVAIGTLYDLSGLLEKYGVKSVNITSGKNKAMGSIVEPLTKEQQAIFQSLVDEAYEQFIGIVSEERNLDPDTTREIADGRIHTAKQALELGLIDGICSFDEAVSDMVETYDLHNCEIVDIYYVDTSLFGTLFSKIKMPDLGSSDAHAILTLIKNDVEFPISYICEILN